MSVVLGCLALGMSGLIVTVAVVTLGVADGVHRRGVARLAEHRARVDAAVRRHPAGRLR